MATTQTGTIGSTAPATRAVPRRANLLQQQRRWGWIFISPWIIGFFLFTAFPMAASLFFSFTNFQIGQPIVWIGLKNWTTLFSDPITAQALSVTFRFGLLALPVSIIFPLGMASLLNSKYLIGKPFFRLLFYMPYIVPAISGIFIWQAFLNGDSGWLNRILRMIGISDPPSWLQNPAYINTALVMIGLWGVGNAMLTMMAGMQGVPTELYEAARVDGAGPATQFRRITLPMISPVIFYNVVLTTIGLMQYFTIPYVLSTNSRSDPSTRFINLHLYRTMFEEHNMGLASAMAWLIFAIGMLITIVLFALSRRWVYYASGD
jgi:multiple sugar transport system permease protein